MRQLPVYLLLDTSGSMSGEPIEALRNGVEILVQALRKDPQALETVCVSIILFGSDATQVLPLTELAQLSQAQLKKLLGGIAAGGQTSLGAALALAAQRIDQEVRKTTAQIRGDWLPLIYIMTDGLPTDDWRQGLAAFRRVQTGIVVACAAGSGADDRPLREITSNVLHLDTVTSSDISAYMKWVSQTIAVSSRRIDGGGGQITSLSDLPPPPDQLTTLI